ncbi:MAG: hypothetical protein MH112_02620 [Phenylobacterium sp.]|jgi:hypothetical protein|nr:hypothetical protein [Phenylobacterium sp.]MCG9915238.1 hypothetical protein [Phenylobacterium sp.]
MAKGQKKSNREVRKPKQAAAAKPEPATRSFLDPAGAAPGKKR